MASFSSAFGRLYHALALVACVLLFAMMVVICGDVFLRNVPLIRTLRGFPATNDLCEAFLYLITLLSSPWLLRKGQHIRVDVLLRAIPKRWAWYCEWAVDALGLACCLVLMWYGAAATLDAYRSGEMFIKALATPAWWWLVFLPLTFALLAVEFVFRMLALGAGERGPRNEAVSAA
jgi:TRAP-type C4-dicarboxylate transport system permease small subunit